MIKLMIIILSILIISCTNETFKRVTPNERVKKMKFLKGTNRSKVNKVKTIKVKDR